jgi:hypothetical protein
MAHNGDMNENDTTNQPTTRECGVCPTARPGAVDWGCTCGMTAEQVNAEATEFARQHG